MVTRLILAALAGVLIAGCGSTDAPDRPQAPVLASANVQGTLGTRCASERWQASEPKHVTFSTADHVELFAAELGDGPRGLVLLHGTSASALCNWAKAAPWLVAAGYHVLAIDHRCQGFSGCGTGTEDALDKDVVAAVRKLRGLGAKTVTVVGESRGGAVALAAAARPDADMDAVVSLSGVWFDGSYTGPSPAALPELVTRITVPTLYVSSLDDDLVDQAEYHALSEATAHSEAVVLKAAGHGALMLGTDEPSAFYRKQFTAFLARQ